MGGRSPPPTNSIHDNTAKESTGAAFEVDDIAAIRDRLIAHGVPVSELHSFPNCSAVFVTDPEGNRFALHQRKS
jgi:predicted enzyme related to lactoylglutathione lyase